MKKLDFAAMKREGVLESHQHLARYEEFTKPVDKAPAAAQGKILLYAFLAYHIKSPLMELEDLTERKQAAFKQAKLDKVKVSEEFDWAQIINLEHKDFLKIVTRVLILCGSREWELMVTGQEAFRQVMAKARQPVDTEMEDDKQHRSFRLKAELMEDATKIHDKITEREKFFFGEDVELKEATTINNDLEDSDMAEGIAERMARKYQNNED